MKLSMTPSFPGYDPEAHLLSIKVRLDGVVIKNVIALDTEKGTIVTLGPPNNFLVPPVETVSTGKVEVLDFDTDRVLYATPDKDQNQ